MNVYLPNVLRVLFVIDELQVHQKLCRLLPSLFGLWQLCCPLPVLRRPRRRSPAGVRFRPLIQQHAKANLSSSTNVEWRICHIRTPTVRGSLNRQMYACRMFCVLDVSSRKLWIIPEFVVKLPVPFHDVDLGSRVC